MMVVRVKFVQALCLANSDLFADKEQMLTIPRSATGIRSIACVIETFLELACACR